MTQDDSGKATDISVFARSRLKFARSRLKVVRELRSADCAAREGNVIPWPASEANTDANLTLSNVQIAIKDKVYAEKLRGLLEEDNRHRAFVVDSPNPAMDGLIVLDETTLQHRVPAEGSAALRYIVLCKESSDTPKLWEAGVRCLVPAE